MTTNLGEFARNFTPEVIAEASRLFSVKRVSRIEFDPVFSTISGIVKEDDNTLLSVKILVQTSEGGQTLLNYFCQCGAHTRCPHAMKAISIIRVIRSESLPRAHRGGLRPCFWPDKKDR